MKRFFRILSIAVVAALLFVQPGMMAGAEPEVLLPASMQVIEAETFFRDTGIIRATVPEGVREIGARAFAYSGLKEISIPASVTYIARDAFEGCTGLTIKAPDGSYAQKWAKGWQAENDNSSPIASAQDFEYGISTSGCTIIRYKGRASTLVIPATLDGKRVIGISKDFIKDNPFVTSVTIPGSVAKLDDWLFYKCANLVSVVLRKGVQHIGKNAFSYCPKLVSVSLPDSLKTIGEKAFISSENLLRLDIPEGVTEIRENTFAYCSSLTEVTLPQTLKYIRPYAFFSCSSLRQVAIPAGVRTIEQSAFDNCGLMRVDFSEGLETIGENAFNWCTGLKRLVFPESLKTIDRRAFQNCTALETVNFPGGLLNIGYRAFYACSSLTGVDVPAGVAGIGAEAFSECPELTLEVDPGSLAQHYATGYGIPCVIHGAAQGQGNLEGMILSASGNDAVAGAQVSLYRSNDSLAGRLPSAAGGRYAFTGLPAGDYRVEVEAEGYLPFTDFVTVRVDETTSLQTFLMIRGESGRNGVASGCITDAITGEPLSGVSLTFRAGWDNDGQGESLASAITDADGCYRLTLPGGNYTAATHCQGYTDSRFNLVAVPDAETPDQNHMLASVVNGNQYRFVLTWDANPRDLDAHVEGVKSDGSRFHVYFDNKSATDGGATVCNLDRDDTQGNGREVVTLTLASGKAYSYYVHHYAGEGTIASSGARVEVYCGARLLRVINVPVSVSSAKYWDVLTIRGGIITLVNGMSDTHDDQTDPAVKSLEVYPESDPLYLGVGQTVIPRIRYIDGQYRAHFDTFSPANDSVVQQTTAGYQNGICGLTLGETEVEQHVNVIEGEYMAQNTSFNARVVYQIPKALSMAVGERRDVTPKEYIGTGNTVNLRKVVWSSSDESVATVSCSTGTTGTVVARKPGKVTLTMRGVNCGAEVSTVLTVGNPPTQINFDRSELVMGAGEKLRFVTGPSSDSSAISITYGPGEVWSAPQFKSSRNEVVTVSDDGIVTAGMKTNSIANITVTAGSVSARITVHVRQAPTGIVFKDDDGTVTNLVTLRGLKIQLPRAVVTGGTANKITYSPPEAAGGIMTFYGDRDITATTYNQKEAKLHVRVESGYRWEAVKRALDSYARTERKLGEKLRAFNKGEFGEAVRRFDDIIFNRMKDTVGEMIMLGNSISLSNDRVEQLPEDVKAHFTELIRADLKKSSPKLKDCKGGNELVRKITELVLNGQSRHTFTVASGTYTYEGSSFGSTAAGLTMGELKRVNADGTTTRFTMLMTVQNDQKIQAYMNDLRDLADAKIKDVITEAVNDSAKLMGLDEAFEYLQTLADESDDDMMGYLLDNASYYVAEKGRDVFAALITTTREQAGLLKKAHDEFFSPSLKEEAKEILECLDQEALNKKDLDELRKALSDDKIMQYVSQMEHASGALFTTLETMVIR